MLQKFMGVGGGTGELSLGCQPEQLVDDTILREGIALGEPLKLAFAEHMHGFIALDGPLGRGERSKPQARPHTTLHKPMVLLHHII
jgi:hypothetical protein